jgi:hypothetical protein
MLHHPALVAAPKPIAAPVFFEEYCVELLRIRGEDCAKLSGVYAFELAGEGGGSWSISFADRTVTRGVASASTLVVSMAAKDFSAMLAGKLDVARSVAAGRINVRGLVDCLANLSAIFG